VPRDRSAFNASVFRCRAILDDVVGLEVRQMEPSLGLKCVQPLDAGVLGAKGEPNALQRLSLKPIRFRGLCHLL
jgi:hypothetical protein